MNKLIPLILTLTLLFTACSTHVPEPEPEPEEPAVIDIEEEPPVEESSSVATLPEPVMTEEELVLTPLVFDPIADDHPYMKTSTRIIYEQEITIPHMRGEEREVDTHRLVFVNSNIVMDTAVWEEKRSLSDSTLVAFGISLDEFEVLDHVAYYEGDDFLYFIVRHPDGVFVTYNVLASPNYDPEIYASIKEYFKID